MTRLKYLIGGFAVFLSVTFLSYTIFTRIRPTPTPTPFALVTPPTPTPTPDPLAPINVLVLGYAGPNHDGGNLTDTLILAHINPKIKKVTLISIPRDLWVTLPLNQTSSQPSKINTAWAIGNDDRHYPQKTTAYSGESGGLNLATYAVQTVTGLPIHYVVAVNFQGFEDIIRLVGDITVTVPHTFDDYFYPIAGLETDACGKPPEEIQTLTATMSGDLLEHQFPCRYEHLHFDSGTVTMDAPTALKFVRSRHSDIGGGDFGRSTRQQALIAALKDKLFSVSTLPKLIPLTETILKSVKTSIDLAFIQKLLTIYPSPSEFTITAFTLNQKELIGTGKSSDGQYILMPVAGQDNFSVIHQFIDDTLAGRPTLSPTAAASPSATLIPR